MKTVQSCLEMLTNFMKRSSEEPEAKRCKISWTTTYTNKFFSDNFRNQIALARFRNIIFWNHATILINLLDILSLRQCLSSSDGVKLWWKRQHLSNLTFQKTVHQPISMFHLGQDILKKFQSHPTKLRIKLKCVHILYVSKLTLQPRWISSIVFCCSITQILPLLMKEGG